jgi:hypothetical protein
METKHNIPNIELRSEEVQELMGKIPPTILRVGISFILGFVIIIFIASNFVRYPDVTTIPIVARNVNFMADIKAMKSGVIRDLSMDYGEVCRGDTLAKIITENGDSHDTVFIRSPFTGIVYPCNALQENDYVEANSALCVIVDSVRDRITAKSTVSADLRKRINPGTVIESDIDGVVLHGKVKAIADYANPDNGAYAIAVTFEAARKLENTIVWNTHANAKIRITERSIFDKFFKKKIIQNF